MLCPVRQLLDLECQSNAKHLSSVMYMSMDKFLRQSAELNILMAGDRLYV